MENFQLYNTNILLSGLVCWDVYLDRSETGSLVSNFRLTPVNNNIPYNYTYSSGYMLNYPHEENVMDLYSDIPDKFYAWYIDPALKSIYPYLPKDGYDFGQVHNNIYEMGCTRTRYQGFKKTFQILCPVWLENIKDNESLSFELMIKSPTGYVISKSVIPFKKIGNNTHLYHNQFVDYFNKYLTNVNILGAGNNNLINIDLKNQTSLTLGMSLISGELKTETSTTMVSNILHRERPLLEVDNMIIKEFKINKMIASLLFNFRFHFNLEDILNNSILRKIPWSEFLVSILARVDDGTKPNYLPIVDFFNNYESISRKYCHKYLDGKEDINGFNVLDYLKDNRVVDLIGKNKLYNPIIHWALCDNNDYIFNVYGGFSGFSFNENGLLINHKTLYADAPDLTQKNYYQNLNNLNWCNRININLNTPLSFSQLLSEKLISGLNITDITFAEFINYDNLNTLYENLRTHLGKQWANNVKYDTKKIKEEDCIDVIIGVLDGPLTKDHKNIINNSKNNLKIVDFTTLESEENFSTVTFVEWKGPVGKLIYILSENPSHLTFSAIKSLMNSVPEEKLDNTLFGKLKNIFNNVVYPRIINFTNSLSGFNALSPAFESKEITYYKENNTVDKTILRYDGKIKPVFLSEGSKNKNILYVKNNSNDLELPKFYLQSEFQPLYPSIGYYSIEGLNMDYDSPLNIKELNKYFKDEIEYKWFNNSKILYAPAELSVDIEFTKGLDELVEHDEFKNKIFDEVAKKYNIKNNTLKNYIISIYEYIIMSDETTMIIVDDESKLNYKYQIKLKLK